MCLPSGSNRPQKEFGLKGNAEPPFRNPPDTLKVLPKDSPLELWRSYIVYGKPFRLVAEAREFLKRFYLNCWRKIHG